MRRTWTPARWSSHHRSRSGGYTAGMTDASTDRLLLLERILQQVKSKLTCQSVCGYLKSAIHDHGPITRQNMSSAAKRIVSNILGNIPHIEASHYLKVVNAAEFNRMAVAEVYLIATEEAERLSLAGDLKGAVDQVQRAQWAREKYHDLLPDAERIDEEIRVFLEQRGVPSHIGGPCREASAYQSEDQNTALLTT